MAAGAAERGTVREMSSVLFICSGNICRSPFAERYAAAQAVRRGSGLTFASAGFEALEGYPMDPVMAEQLRTRGGVDGGFRARALDVGMLEDAELVLTMTLRQRHLLRSGFPYYQDKVHTLGLVARVAPAIGAVPDPAALAEAVGDRLDKLVAADDLADPYRLGPAAAAQVADRIAGQVEALLDALV